jgi:hypothetical protein
MLGDCDKGRVDDPHHRLRGAAAQQQQQEVFREAHMTNDIAREVMTSHDHPVRGRDCDAARQDRLYAGRHHGPPVLLERSYNCRGSTSHTIYSHGEIG